MFKKFLTSLILTISILSPLSADIIYSGELIQPHIIRLEGIYERLPQRGKEFDVPVSVVHHHDWKYNPLAMGVWDPSPAPEIFLQENWWTDHAFVHEFAHHAYFVGMPPEMRDEWRTFWANNRNKMPSAYAKTSPDEGFAECYTYKYYRRSLNKKVAKKLHELVMRGYAK